MLQQLIIAGIAFTVVMLAGGVVFYIIHRRHKKQLQARLDGDHLSHTAATASTPASPGVSWLTRWIQHIGRAYTPGEPSPSLRERLARAGYFTPQAAAVYLGTKIVLLLAGLGIAAILVLPLASPAGVKAVMIGVGAGFCFFLPNLFIQHKLGKRTAQVRQYLPDATDLLDICVSTGQGLDTAWNCVADEIRRVSPILADEMALTNLEMHLGADRAVAMRHMAQRTGAVELQSLVSILVQSQRFGTSVSEALRTFANMMREARSNRASEAAEKLAIKLIFPLVVFIFPAILIVAAGPAGIKIAQLFGGD